jgi:hypothetical protein
MRTFKREGLNMPFFFSLQISRCQSLKHNDREQVNYRPHAKFLLIRLVAAAREKKSLTPRLQFVQNTN